MPATAIEPAVTELWNFSTQSTSHCTLDFSPMAPGLIDSKSILKVRRATFAVLPGAPPTEFIDVSRCVTLRGSDRSLLPISAPCVRVKIRIDEVEHGKADRHRHPASNWPIMRLHDGYDKQRLAALSVNSVLAFPFTSCHCLSFIFIRARPISVSEHTGRTPSVFGSLHKFLPSPVGRQRRFLHLAVFLRSNLIRPDAERLRSRKQMTD